MNIHLIVVSCALSERQKYVLLFIYFHMRGPYISCYLFLGWLFDIGAGIRERVTTWWIGLLVVLIGWFCSLQCGSFIQKKESERSSGPVQLSKFLAREKDEGGKRSVISGKKIMMKLEKSKEDKAAESKRNELLKFLNASYD